MLSHRLSGLWNTYHGVLVVILTFLFWIYLAIISVVFKYIDIQGFQRFILFNLAAVVGLAVAAIRERGTSATLLAGGFVECHTRALKQTVYVGVAILVVLLAAVDPPGSRVLKLSLILGFLLVSYIVLLSCHLFLPGRLADQLFSGEYEQRTLLIGPVEKAREIARWFDQTAAFKFGLKGSVADNDSEKSRILHISRVEDVALLEKVIMHEGIKQIILLEIPLDKEALRLTVNVANRTGVCLLVLNNLRDIFEHDITFFNLHSKDFIRLRDQPLEDPLNRILKRTVDVLVSLPVIIFILPPSCLLVKILQAIQSPGPLFSRETRGGIYKRPFRSFSFRTTRVERGDAGKRAATDEERMYPAGCFLRRTGFYEIPRFLNVFFGCMSVVGPRPHIVIHNRRFSEIMEEYNVRTWAKPGITGLAQITGHRGEPGSEEDVRARAKKDIEYIENWSLPLDFWIIFNTMLQVIKPPKTAY
jgi:lipopolysaccharide/colanic/teichoic acid biosynthesis glycosyltransferase